MPALSKQAVIGSLLSETYDPASERLTLPQVKSIRRHAERAALRGQPVGPDVRTGANYSRLFSELAESYPHEFRGENVTYGAHGGMYGPGFFEVPGMGQTALHEFGHAIDNNERTTMYRFTPSEATLANAQLKSESIATRKAIDMLRAVYGVDRITDPVAKKQALNKVYERAGDLASAFDTYADTARSIDGFKELPPLQDDAVHLYNDAAGRLRRLSEISDGMVQHLDPGLVEKVRKQNVHDHTAPWVGVHPETSPIPRRALEKLRTTTSERPTYLQRAGMDFGTYIPGGPRAVALEITNASKHNRDKLLESMKSMTPEEAEVLRGETINFVNQTKKYLGRDAQRGVIRKLIEMRNALRGMR